MERFSVEAYRPQEIALKLEDVCASKSTTQLSKLFALAFLAGFFIGLGALFFTLVVHDAEGLSFGVARLLGGLVFCLGLILVVVAGAELFTGNNLLAMAFMHGRITLRQLLRNWVVVYCGNLAGALALVVLVWCSGHWYMNNAALGAEVLHIANAKVNLDFVSAVSRGILCNILVCLAVWLCFAGRSVSDKILAILFPITAFVALGLEHSVANMYFIPAGLIAANDPVLVAAASHMGGDADFANLTIYNFLLANLLPVTLGNVIGGSMFVSIFYWFIYLRD